VTTLGGCAGGLNADCCCDVKIFSTCFGLTEVKRYGNIFIASKLFHTPDEKSRNERKDDPK